MHDRHVLTSLPYPLNAVHTAADVRGSGDTLEHLDTLLEQSLGMAMVLTVATRSSDVSEQDLVASLEVLSGYLEATLALFEAWQAGQQAQHEAAEAQRDAWVTRPLPQEVDATLAELRTLFEQSPPTPAALAALVGLVRTAVSASGIPPDRPPASSEEA